MNLPEQISMLTAHRVSQPRLPRVGQQSKRESRLSLESSTNASACRRRLDRAQRPRHAPHPQIVPSRDRLVRPLPIAAETLDSRWMLSQSRTLPSTSRVVPQSRPRLRLRHESILFGLSSAQQCRIPRATLWFVRIGVPLAAILISAGFFFSVLPPTATQASGAVALIYAGALILAVGVVTIGIGLLRSPQPS